MSEFIGRVLEFDPVSGLLALPMWAAGALAAIAVVGCLLAFRRAGYDGLTGTVARVGLILIGAVATWCMFGASPARDISADRRALDARVTELTARAIAPGSALACLDATAGAAVEGACEKALFATPEATAAAVSYVSAQLALLADASEHVQRDSTYANLVTQLRRAAETDRFGIVAHVLSAREGCSTQRCDAFALLTDTSRVTSNIADHTYEAYVERYAANWPAASAGTLANGSSPAGPLTASNATPGALPLKPPGPDVFFPSADSIPPVNIMTAEPPAPAATPPVSHQATTGSGARAAKQSSRKAAPAPKQPFDLNSEAARGAPVPLATDQ